MRILRGPEFTIMPATKTGSDIPPPHQWTDEEFEYWHDKTLAMVVYLRCGRFAKALALFSPEEIVNEIFRRLAEDRRHFQADVDVEEAIRRLTYSVVQDIAKKEARRNLKVDTFRSDPDQLKELPDAHPTPQEAIQNGEFVTNFLHFVEDRDDDVHKFVQAICHLDTTNLRQIAAYLRLSYPQIRRRRNKARKLLRLFKTTVESEN